MSTETLNVEKRDQTGSLRMKRLRQTGKIPAILYGHGEECVKLTLSAKELSGAINRGSYLVQLKGASNESALIKDVQWDTFGVNVLHVDLTRVSAGEAVEVTVPIELKGEADAPGVRAGGALNFIQQQISVSCPANAIPENIELKVNELNSGETISAGSVPLPNGVTLAEDESNPIVSCEDLVDEAAKDEEE
ncbi:MAG: 50S ribosomal protein L25 [Planctomycetota bacterium]